MPITRKALDLGDAVALIEADSEGGPYITLFRRDAEGNVESFILQGDVQYVVLFAESLLTACDEVPAGGP